MLRNPSGYGRLVTSSTGSLDAIIEDSEASASQKMITNVNSGIMAFKWLYNRRDYPGR